MGFMQTYNAEEMVEDLRTRLHAQKRYTTWGDIAIAVGLTRATLWKMMKGEVDPSLDSMLRIVRWLDAVESPTPTPTTQDEVSV